MQILANACMHVKRYSRSLGLEQTLSAQSPWKLINFVKLPPVFKILSFSLCGRQTSVDFDRRLNRYQLTKPGDRKYYSDEVEEWVCTASCGDRVHTALTPSHADCHTNETRKSVHTVCAVAQVLRNKVSSAEIMVNV